MKFKNGNGDRRQGYSFRGHFKRVLETKGLRHILFSTFGTLAIVSLAFAYCGGSGITGPSNNGGTVSAPVSGSPHNSPDRHEDDHEDDPPIDPGLLIIPIDIGPPTAIETSFGPIMLPIDMQATPCNKDVVKWDPKRTYVVMSGVMVLRPATGQVYIRGRFTQRSQGVGTIVIPVRRYTGWEEYEKEFYLNPPVAVNEEEFEMKIMAKGNIEPFPLYPNDDFYMYVRVRTVMVAGIVRIESVKAYTKCW